jgi:hypothetical protein
MRTARLVSEVVSATGLTAQLKSFVISTRVKGPVVQIASESGA